jgi:hypothetical protein
MLLDVLLYCGLYRGCAPIISSVLEAMIRSSGFGQQRDEIIFKGAIGHVPN